MYGPKTWLEAAGNSCDRRLVHFDGRKLHFTEAQHVDLSGPLTRPDRTSRVSATASSSSVPRSVGLAPSETPRRQPGVTVLRRAPAALEGHGLRAAAARGDAVALRDGHGAEACGGACESLIQVHAPPAKARNGSKTITFGPFSGRGRPETVGERLEMVEWPPEPSGRRSRWIPRHIPARQCPTKSAWPFSRLRQPSGSSEASLRGSQEALRGWGRLETQLSQPFRGSEGEDDLACHEFDRVSKVIDPAYPA